MVEHVIINQNNLQINIIVDSPDFIGLTFWDSNGYNNNLPGISIPLPTPYYNRYLITIEASEVGLTSFDGVFFLKFLYTGPGEGTTTEELICVSNYTKYYECLLDKTLKTDFKGCKEVKEDCPECKSKSACYINALLKSLELALRNNYYKEANMILETLDEYCEVCNNCPKKINRLVPGYGLNYILVRN